MASRLYPTTRRLFQQVVQSLTVLGLTVSLSPLAFALLAIYITGVASVGSATERDTPGRSAASPCP